MTMMALVTWILEEHIRFASYMAVLYLLTLSYVQCLPTSLIQEGVETGSSPDYTSSHDTTIYEDDEDLMTPMDNMDDNSTDSTTPPQEDTTKRSSIIIHVLFVDWTLLAILAGVEVLAYLFSLTIIYMLKHSGKNSALPIGRRKPLYRTISWKF